MKIGYFFNGFLGDKLLESSKDSPDGNAWYSSSIIEEFLSKGHSVFRLGIDKDKEEYSQFGDRIFESFEKEKRHFAYVNSTQVDWVHNEGTCQVVNKPQLDMILLEWRFPIEGRNTVDDIHTTGFQYDYLMQEYLLKEYTCPITVLDLDYKMTIEDEEKLSKKGNVTVIETSNNSVKRILDRVQVDIPFWMKRSSIVENIETSKYKDIVYIGSRYERDRSIQDYLVSYSDRELFKVWFYGNWRKYKDKYDELYSIMNWRNIQYHNRVGHDSFKEIYSDSLCCPLLAKDEYYKNGFMTARIQECLYFGSIPIGFKEHYTIDKYLPEFLIAKDSDDFYVKVQDLKKLTVSARNEIRQNLWENLEFMDTQYFVEKILNFTKKEI